MVDSLNVFSQVFEVERMSTKRAMYHKKCFTCFRCKTAMNYGSAVEAPDDEVRNYSITPLQWFLK